MEQDKKYTAIVVGGTGAVGKGVWPAWCLFRDNDEPWFAGSWLVRFLCRSGEVVAHWGVPPWLTL